VLPSLPSNEKNSSDHHNSYNKGPNLAFDHHNSYNKYPNLVFFSFTESPSNFLFTIKFPKNHITPFYHSNMSKIATAKIWPLRALGLRITCNFQLVHVLKNSVSTLYKVNGVVLDCIFRMLAPDLIYDNSQCSFERIDFIHLFINYRL
jgi:hypothetical protein